MSALARRMSAQQALALPAPAASNTVVINARCSLRIEADQRVIVVAGLPVHHYRAEDGVAEAYAMVFLVESGFAQQTETAAPKLAGRSCTKLKRTGLSPQALPQYMRRLRQLGPERQQTGQILVRTSPREKPCDSNHRNRLCQEV